MLYHFTVQECPIPPVPCSIDAIHFTYPYAKITQHIIIIIRSIENNINQSFIWSSFIPSLHFLYVDLSYFPSLQRTSFNIYAGQVCCWWIPYSYLSKFLFLFYFCRIISLDMKFGLVVFSFNTKHFTPISYFHCLR